MYFPVSTPGKYLPTCIRIDLVLVKPPVQSSHGDDLLLLHRDSMPPTPSFTRCPPPPTLHAHPPWATKRAPTSALACPACTSSTTAAGMHSTQPAAHVTQCGSWAMAPTAAASACGCGCSQPGWQTQICRCSAPLRGSRTASILEATPPGQCRRLPLLPWGRREGCCDW
eukprot:COSAG01_NODE_3265_length_6333_cov_16.099775_2_plen_169_part_00